VNKYIVYTYTVSYGRDLGHRRGGGLRQINHLRKVPLKVIFFITTFGIAFYQSNLFLLSRVLCYSALQFSPFYNYESHKKGEMEAISDTIVVPARSYTSWDLGSSHTRCVHHTNTEGMLHTVGTHYLLNGTGSQFRFQKV
jgi:hypothetical protein